MNDAQYYKPDHAVTENYFAGLAAIDANRLHEAVAILSSEPPTSPCRGLALANKALAQLHLEVYSEAEATGKLALREFKTHGCPHPPTWLQTARNLGECLALQDRPSEAFGAFRYGCRLGTQLIKDFPSHEAALELEQAHTFNSWGGALLKSRAADDAIDCFIQARDIYRKYPLNKIGCAETLTNLAQAYTVLGELTKASLALQEAEQLLSNDPEQLNRILIARSRAGLLSRDESIALFRDAANDALRRRAFDTAYLRHCIAADLAHSSHDAEWGLQAVNAAEAIEADLDPTSLHPAKLRFFKAAFLEQQGNPAEKVLSVLLQGAKLWCERLPGALNIEDYRQAASLMHDHFRWTSQKLIELGRIEEAFVTFAIGTARAFAVRIHGGYDHPLVAGNPYQNAKVDCSLLQAVQGNLKEDETIVALACLEMNVVAFVVSRTEIKTCQVVLKDAQSAGAFGQALQNLPSNLEQRKGEAAVPQELLELAKQVAGLVGTRKIVLLAPHSILHAVPWRTILRNTGMPWAQLPFVAQFSPLLDPQKPNPDAVPSASCCALGFGVTGSGASELNLEDEARAFAQVFEREGAFCGNARSADVKHALGKDQIVLVSCHGNVHATESGQSFTFSLADGSVSIQEILLDKVKAPLVVLSACSSGVYEMEVGDYPMGVVPELLFAGAQFCICTRFPVSAHFAKEFFPTIAALLRQGKSIGNAFSTTCEKMESEGQDRWRHIACLELIGRGSYKQQGSAADSAPLGGQNGVVTSSGLNHHCLRLQSSTDDPVRLPPIRIARHPQRAAKAESLASLSAPRL